jgi:hypothetical protein
MADNKNNRVTIDIGGWFKRQAEKYQKSQRDKKVAQNQKALSKKKAVAGFETYKPTDTSKGMFSTYRDKIANRGALKVTPGNIGGSSFKIPTTPSIHQGKAGEQIGPTVQSTTPNIPNKPNLKVGTGKGNAYYPSTEAYKDKQRKETARKAKDIKQPRRIHEATRMARKLLNRNEK